MSEKINVKMLLDVELTVDSECRVAFDQHGDCFIINEVDGEIKYVAVDYVKPVPAPVEEPVEEVSEETDLN